MQPLYRRGPNWTSRIHSAQWPSAHLYGPPVAHDVLPAMNHVREFDCRVFALYFLLTESLATYVGYRIVQHCLQGRRLRFITPTTRLWITFVYSLLKLSLIDFAFHGSLYSFVSMMLAFFIAFSGLLAVGFHYGPLQLVFTDVIVRRKNDSRPFNFQQIVQAIQRFCVRQHFREYALALARNDKEMAPPVISLSPTSCERARVTWLIAGTVEFEINAWNEWITRSVTKAIVKHARSRSKPSLHLEGTTEARFLVLVLENGLILDFLLKQPTASFLAQLRTDDVRPIELVARFFMTAATAPRDRTPMFLYAECAKLVGSANRVQKKTILKILQQLNAFSGHIVDVPLRSLRCQDFIQAECFKQQRMRRTKPRNDTLSSQLELTFG
ncbi:hypothetical protein Poli38472_014145 [Pythium oligandrum]|uniref:Uncharacterized protein n=1 Tax=Pythium oligandrum TaxID=41045 RepID=A0A8K1CKH0_PYTOL|nr:hypothetical protein Poli38472_014145 [Pythium oligandrum]|eukprot:TMW64028.1 hypothetical protein Poli38472_014145 [Pythium oligandrum]